jgi:hypothetical protein
MKLNHINLTVTDVVAAAEFPERYFGLEADGFEVEPPARRGPAPVRRRQPTRAPTRTSCRPTARA